MAIDRQLSFAGGELAPSLNARVDTNKYKTGLKKCRNGLVLRNGGVANRPGTRFITEVKDSSKAVRIVQFFFNEDQTYILEFGDLYMRVIKNGVSLPAGGPAYEIATPYTAAQLFDLDFAQSADVVTIVHPSHEPRELVRLADTNWTLTCITFAPGIDPPASGSVTGTAGVQNWIYEVAAVSAAGEVSLGFQITGVNLTPSTTNPHTVSWAAAAGAVEYYVYLQVNGVPSYVGTARSTNFLNDGITPDPVDTPPLANNPFSGADNFPSAVTYYQQRIVYANTNNNPERVWASRVGFFHNFTTSTPLQDDDAVDFTLVGKHVNAIRNLLDVGTLIIFTTGGEWEIRGDDAGVLRPTSINARQHSYNGSGPIAPVVVGGNALYLQARESIVRDLGFDFRSDGYKGNDLTIFAAHLFDDFNMADWAYQQTPNSILWVVRSDGTLLGLTYIREHEIWAWHRHDTEGSFESVASVPETEGGIKRDVLYAVVNRTIDGNTVRYIERFHSRKIIGTEVRDLVFMDSALSFDGRNTTATTMTLTGGPPWTTGLNFTLTASAGFFAGVSEIGNDIHMTGANGLFIRCRIVGYTSPTVVTIQPDRDIPVSLQGVAITNWARAVDELTGLDHLEGEDVAVFGDGFVVGSPNNPGYSTIYNVSGGAITLADPYAVIHVGLPYLADFETLNIDSVEGETLMNKRILISKVTLNLEETRGVWVGPKEPASTAAASDGLRELKLRDEEGYDDPVALATGIEDIIIRGDYSRGGTIFVRQLDPLPMTLLALAPEGDIPFKR